VGTTWFDCGWNDTVYGLTTCPNGQEMLSYIARMRKAIATIIAGGLDNGYSRGAQSAIEQALETGLIPDRRKENG
jgi:hypothetical protein